MRSGLISLELAMKRNLNKLVLLDIRLDLLLVAKEISLNLELRKM